MRNSQYNECTTSLLSTHGVSVAVETRAKMLAVSEDEYSSSNANNNDPICRIVATSDGKISPPTAVASLSCSSKSLLDKIQLIYAVESQKQLRDLAYMTPQLTFESMKNTRAMDGTCDVGHEDNLISILKTALNDGGYKLMNQRDLDLCSALNAGYLLRLSLVPDIKELDPCIGREFYPDMYEQFGDSQNKMSARQREITSLTNPLLFDGRVLVFRRGYSKEITSGRLLLPKLDYLQASLVQRSSSALTRKLGEFEKRIEDLFLNFVSVLSGTIQGAYDQNLRYLGQSTKEGTGNIELENGESQAQRITINDAEANTTLSSNATRGNKVFKFTRYQALSNLFDLNNALSPFLQCDIVDNTSYSAQDDMNGVVKSRKVLCQYDDEFLSETSESVRSFSLLERISVQNTVDFFTVKGRRELIKNFFKSSTLVEPAFEEVIVISKLVRKKKPETFALNPPRWLYEAAKVFDVEDRLPSPKNKTHDDVPTIPIPIDIKVFSDVPMANIEAVLPKSKLIFRPADAVVFDLVSLVSFLAVAGSLRFDSPKLDLIALISLIVFVLQTFFRYSNKYARYDLIVNKFITSKVLYRGPGKKKIMIVMLIRLRQLSISPVGMILGALRHILSEANRNRALRSV